MSSSATGSSPEGQRGADPAAETQRKADALAAETTAKADALAEETATARSAADLAVATLQRAADLAAETAAKALALAASLDQNLVNIVARLDQYSAFGQRSRKIIIGLAVSFVLDIVLTVVLGLTAFAAHDTASANAQLVQELHMQQAALHMQQAALHAAQLQACAGGNTFRADQDTIWRDFIGLLAKPAAGESPAQVAKTNQLATQFLGYVATVNHAVNCAALYGK